MLTVVKCPNRLARIETWPAFLDSFMWHGILGHDDVIERFRRMLSAGRLASTYLFVGPPGIGKKRVALELAKCMLCQQTPPTELAACGECDSCRLFVSGNHPDLEVISRPADKSELPIAMFVGDDEHRNQEGLCQRIALRPFFGGRRVAIIDDADHFSIASANCLLKTLEEPPPRSILFLIGSSTARQLPTIRSRAQIVRFRPLATDEVAQILLDIGAVADRQQAARLAALGEGSVERAAALADPALVEFRDTFLGALQNSPEGIRLARAVQAFVDEAGKESSRKRDRLRIVVDWAVEHCRTQLWRQLGQADRQEASAEALPTSDQTHRAANTVAAVAALDACLKALEHVDRNANLGLVIQNWCEALTGFAGAERPVADREKSLVS